MVSVETFPLQKKTLRNIAKEIYHLPPEESCRYNPRRNAAGGDIALRGSTIIQGKKKDFGWNLMPFSSNSPKSLIALIMIVSPKGWIWQQHCYRGFV
jgi:hypothetical protein